jgi:transcriptional regulator with XRE-family HTH domain
MTIMTFGEKVLTLRKQKGWSQRDLVKAIGEAGPSTVSAWENGSTPAMDVALKVARALGVALDYLADDAQESPTASGLTDAERQLWAMAQRHGPERLLMRLEEVGVGSPSPNVDVEVNGDLGGLGSDDPRVPWDAPT